MKPVLEERKKFNYLTLMYIGIFLICTIGIGVAVYLQFYQDSNINIALGGSDEESEKEDEYNNLKSEISSIFTNDIEVLQEDTSAIEKIAQNYNIVVTGYNYQKEEGICSLHAMIPQINIKKESIIRYNNAIRDKYKGKAEELSTSLLEENTIYNVTYKAYLQNDILSLIIRAELKEGTKSQKIEINTLNYHIKEDREVTLQELITLKNVTIEDADERIRSEIKKIQEQNEAFSKIVSDQGSLYKRDYNSSTYKVENTKEYFLGKDGMLYLVYAYGNNDYTNEMDIVIFQ